MSLKMATLHAYISVHMCMHNSIIGMHVYGQYVLAIPLLLFFYHHYYYGTGKKLQYITFLHIFTIK